MIYFFSFTLFPRAARKYLYIGYRAPHGNFSFHVIPFLSCFSCLSNGHCLIPKSEKIYIAYHRVVVKFYIELYVRITKQSWVYNYLYKSCFSLRYYDCSAYFVTKKKKNFCVQFYYKRKQRIWREESHWNWTYLCFYLKWQEGDFFWWAERAK